jgi:hypothetical protein
MIRDGRGRAINAVTGLLGCGAGAVDPVLQDLVLAVPGFRPDLCRGIRCLTEPEAAHAGPTDRFRPSGVA